MRVFLETQKFKQTWFRVVLISISLLTLWPIYSLTNWDKTDTSALIILSICMATTLGMTVYFLVYLRLQTRIDEHGIAYGFEPLPGKMKQKSWDQIKKAYVRKYSPIGEYGGWGYRVSMSKSTGRAYNVSGTIGIQLEFTDGKRLLIGTQMKDEAQEALNYYLNKEQNGSH